MIFVALFVAVWILAVLMWLDSRADAMLRRLREELSEKLEQRRLTLTDFSTRELRDEIERRERA